MGFVQAYTGTVEYPNVGYNGCKPALFNSGMTGNYTNEQLTFSPERFLDLVSQGLYATALVYQFTGSTDAPLNPGLGQSLFMDELDWLLARAAEYVVDEASLDAFGCLYWTIDMQPNKNDVFTDVVLATIVKYYRQIGEPLYSTTDYQIHCRGSHFLTPVPKCVAALKAINNMDYYGNQSLGYDMDQCTIRIIHRANDTYVSRSRFYSAMSLIIDHCKQDIDGLGPHVSGTMEVLDVHQRSITYCIGSAFSMCS